MAMEQYYQDNAEYPSNENFLWISVFLLKIPEDPLDWKIIDLCEFGYKYAVWPDKNWIKNQVYRLSTCFEDKEKDTLYKTDWWIDNKRYEVWLDLDRNYWESKFIRDLEDLDMGNENRMIKKWDNISIHVIWIIKENWEEFDNSYIKWNTIDFNVWAWILIRKRCYMNENLREKNFKYKINWCLLRI